MSETLDERTAAEQLRQLEPIFHRSPPGSGREVFERMTAADYWEVGASGRIYEREFVLDMIEDRYARGAEGADLPLDDFAARPLGGGTWLVTYELDQNGRRTRRATLWSREGSAWSAIYHQGTVIQAD